MGFYLVGNCGLESISRLQGVYIYKKYDVNNFFYEVLNNKVKENFYLLHNNTIKTISKTAKSSILIAIVYHLES